MKTLKRLLLNYYMRGVERIIRKEIESINFYINLPTDNMTRLKTEQEPKELQIKKEGMEIILKIIQEKR